MSLTTWRYAIPNVKSEGWAVVHMDSRGFFGVCSDFGNYAYHWYDFGTQDFREFLIECNDGYLASKLSMGWPAEFMEDASQQNVKRAILRARRSQELTSAEARAEWQLADSISCPVSFGSWLEFTKVGDAWELAAYENCPRLRWFCLRVMPRVREAIRADLEKEKHEQAHSQEAAQASH